MTTHRTQVGEGLARLEEGLAKLVDSRNTTSVQLNPLVRQLVECERSKQRLCIVISQFLAGEAPREALAFAVVQELGSE